MVTKQTLTHNQHNQCFQSISTTFDGKHMTLENTLFKYRTNVWLPNKLPSVIVWVLVLLFPLLSLALTDIFLDNTTALRKKVPASLIGFFFFFNFVETKYMLSYGTFLFCMLLPHWPTTFLALAGQRTLGTSISSIAFFYALRCHIKWHGCFACPFHSVQHLLDCLFYMLCCMRPTKLVCIPARYAHYALQSGVNVILVIFSPAIWFLNFDLWIL